jgi:hypothetical protein
VNAQTFVSLGFRIQPWTHVSADGQVSCGCYICDVWSKFVAGKLFGLRMYEILTVELISSLSDYLRKFQKRGGPSIVLEVGAGNGRLSYFLSNMLNQKDSGTSSRLQQGEYVIISTDSGIRGLDEECGAAFPVEKIACTEALLKYTPDVVISSWMELGQDWTSDFRKCTSVQEYILIGEADSGVCGRLWETWGVCSESGRKRRQPAFEQDGFTRHLLPVPQIGRTDDPWNSRSRSSTVIFRRQSAGE